MRHSAFTAVTFLPGVLSQAISNAKCTVASLSWVFNTLDESPCDVAAALAAVCNHGVFTLDSLGPGLVYLGPSESVANPCRCSTVYYSMLSACAACQGNRWISWNEYSVNCTSSYDTKFPRPLPTGTNVPAWAYIDITVSNNFNLSAAQNLQNLPETTAPPASKTSFGFSTERAATGLPIFSPVSNNNGSGSSSHAGVIAGGIIGGVVGLSAVGLLFFYYRRRRRQNTLPASSAFNTTPYASTPYNDSVLNMSANPSASITSTPPQLQRFYDPSDPSTFPTTPVPLPNSSYNNTHTHTLVSDPFQESAPHSHILPARTGHYTGAPEL